MSDVFKFKERVSLIEFTLSCDAPFKSITESFLKLKAALDFLHPQNIDNLLKKKSLESNESENDSIQFFKLLMCSLKTLNFLGNLQNNKSYSVQELGTFLNLRDKTDSKQNIMMHVVQQCHKEFVIS